jgi:sec-independent protein translocase protein TatA
MSVSPILSFLEGPELLIIAAIILVLFGGAKLPQLARSLGSAQREFKKGLNGDDDKAKNANSQSSNTVDASAEEKTDQA